ncbi:MAG: hypothetical protein EBW06_03640, partial [Gammaproteobacteria bacterium]|nr:hypothetical protein [Gammaproteobacteria bacterium]
MLTSVQLDNRRAEMMHALYERSGRTCGTYTGLWDAFTKEVAANLRDLDYEEVKADCIRAVGGTQSHLAEHHAEACIRIIRNHILGAKWA